MLPKLGYSIDHCFKLKFFSFLFHYFRSYDIIVRKLPEKEIPGRSPQNYTTDDIKKAVDGLYVAIRGEGAPRSGDEVVIGDNQKRENGTVLPGTFIYGGKLIQKQVFLKISYAPSNRKKKNKKKIIKKYKISV